MKFNTGDRARVVAAYSRHRGEVCTVTAVKHGRNLVMPDGLRRGVNCTIYLTDLPLSKEHPLGPGPCGFLAEDLELYYDGNELVSWSECAWKPQRIAG